MKLEVMSRKKFEEYTKLNHRMTSLVISISSFNEEPPRITNNTGNNILSVLSIHFNDTADPSPNAYGISRAQAITIANFVKTGIDLADKIIVHCGAGQSRSAGVAAAILKYYTGSDSDIYDNPKYTPNNLCYRKVLEALMDM